MSMMTAPTTSQRPASTFADRRAARWRTRTDVPLDDVRAEFLDLPGLSLTLAQAGRLFDIDVAQAKRLLETLLDDGFLVRDARGAFRRRDGATLVVHAQPRPRSPNADVHQEASNADSASTGATPSPADVLDAMGVELPCLVC